MALDIFCTTIKYYRILDKLQSFIKPLGLGEEIYPENWFDEKKGDNISDLNKHYAEFTGLYWIWKNKLINKNDKDLIGNCHNRVLWLNDYREKKVKFTFQNLYDNLLKEDNNILTEHEVIQVQPITFKSKNLIKDFEEVHKCDALNKSLEFLDKTTSDNFKKHLNGNLIYPHNMFITNKSNFENYCRMIFPWLEKIHHYCLSKDLYVGYNMRLPAFIAERFTSFWFSQFSSRSLLSYARLGKFHLSNKVNSVLNSSKLPFTYYQYPTIHKF